jgi:hypothetical protein
MNERLRKIRFGCRRFLLTAVGTCGVAVLCVSCTRPGYRDEVYPGAQGQYTLKRVPINEPSKPSSDASVATATPPSPPAAPPPAPTPAPVVHQAPPPTDQDLETIRGLWPKLSPSDRAAVLDMTKHLAAPRP